MAMPIIVVHFGDHPHVFACLRETAKHNRNIYLIGDAASKASSANISTVQWIDYKTLAISAQAAVFCERFVNYSTNRFEFEFRCFQRMFYALSLLESLSCSACFHLDSDCALLTDISVVEFRASDAFAIYPDFGNPLRMAASVHNARLTRFYLQRFCNLAEEIYVHGVGFNLIEEKIRFHRNNRIVGGVCDMTLHYILSPGVQNLGQPYRGAVFDYRFGTAEGDELQAQYCMTHGHKVLLTQNGGTHIEDVRGHRHRLQSIHFQGSSKRFVDILETQVSAAAN